MDENRFGINSFYCTCTVFLSFFLHRFEDGTIPFLDIIAVRHGLDALKKIGGKAIKILHFMTQL